MKESDGLGPYILIYFIFIKRPKFYTPRKIRDTDYKFSKHIFCPKKYTPPSRCPKKYTPQQSLALKNIHLNVHLPQKIYTSMSTCPEKYTPQCPLATNYIHLRSTICPKFYTPQAFMVRRVALIRITQGGGGAFQT